MVDYVRIGTEYYKICRIPLLSGDSEKALIKWSKGEIVTDYGKGFLDSVKRYDGFITIPDNQNYQQEINFFYNEYEKIKHKLAKGRFDKTEQFLRHIFREQYDLGLDYLTILWQLPTQILPILCLVSDSRNTGKTSFLNWLKLLFQGNMTINKNEDFRSRFNSDWSSKLIIAIDEVLLDRREDSERIKNLSTASSYKTESKGKDKIETNFFGKFILCSNNEENFIQIDEKEIRYWVIKVKSFEKEDVNMLKKLKAEVSHFLYFLNTRKIVAERQTRMWFTKQQIYTPALDKVIKGNKTYISQEIKEILIDDFITFEVDVLRYTASDLLEKLSRSNIRTIRNKVSNTLKVDYGLSPINGSYKKYHFALNTANKSILDSETKKGRYFEFEKKDFIETVLIVDE
ncbi:primase-helicase family protein [Polaribacter glomeratus]|uniref:Helicase n=1 Tax=Polaribacter glomeratus TaxID=102 RepID=A0A2S7WYU3_9FLAO|nr:primase-helicase family protein [Polaribacter glomeratus]PQJ82698.1 helicase [Polaribacter glomeratus]TXD63725.1 helicase [Polaribacter glomeratus]